MKKEHGGSMVVDNTDVEDAQDTQFEKLNFMTWSSWHGLSSFAHGLKPARKPYSKLSTRWCARI